MRKDIALHLVAFGLAIILFLVGYLMRTLPLWVVIITAACGGSLLIVGLLGLTGIWNKLFPRIHIREQLGRYLDEGHALSDSEAIFTPLELENKVTSWDDKVSSYVKAKRGIADLALYQDAKGLTPRFSFTEPDPNGKKTTLTYLWARMERLHQLIDRLAIHD